MQPIHATATQHRSCSVRITTDTMQKVMSNQACWRTAKELVLPHRKKSMQGLKEHLHAWQFTAGHHEVNQLHVNIRRRDCCRRCRPRRSGTPHVYQRTWKAATSRTGRPALATTCHAFEPKVLENDPKPNIPTSQVHRLMLAPLSPCKDAT